MKLTETEHFVLEHAEQCGLKEVDEGYRYRGNRAAVLLFAETIARHAYQAGQRGGPIPRLLTVPGRANRTNEQACKEANK